MIITEEFYVSRWIRFANYVVDTIAKFGIKLLLTYLASYIYNDFYSNHWILDVAGGGVNVWRNLFWVYVQSIIFYFILEVTTQRTIGKFVTGTMVVMEDGSKPGADAIIKRTLCRLIPFEAFSFFADTSRGWHDTISGTYVVNVKQYKSALELQNSFDEIGVVQEL
jgi:uncharacterized RDD family membrane protein YckC